MSSILLTTLNARYIHSSLGLRYLMANMGLLKKDTRLLEYNISSRPIDIVEDLLSHKPEIIGFGIYIWNVEACTQVIMLLKAVAPEVTVVVGGPEVSYEYDDQAIIQAADYLITGQADKAFAELCENILDRKPILQKVIHPLPFKLDDIALPYQYYSDEDIAHRIIYVEASRGCPFKCEFCLSALDKTVSPFNLDAFLEQMQQLYDRGVRHFKFVDRTFNLKVDTSIRIMEFFLKRMDENLFLHFELIPDHLPERLKSVIAQFPEHSLQFEIGIQSLNTEVQQLISRKQNTEKTRQNLQWITSNSQAHIHADLIIGLPGEDIESFASGLNQLYAMNPHEIQVGILKRLKGTPIIRHTRDCDIRYNPLPPFNILSNGLIDFPTMQRLSRFARYWDMIINSGRFKYSKHLLLGDSPFENFLALNDWLYEQTGQTHKISLNRLFNLIYQALTELFILDIDSVNECLMQDFQASGLKGQPGFMKQQQKLNKRTEQRTVLRQKRHIS